EVNGSTASSQQSQHYVSARSATDPRRRPRGSVRTNLTLQLLIHDVTAVGSLCEMGSALVVRAFARFYAVLSLCL
ncbi:uncharacterized, partial [Tachysurus ichikawai]